MMRFATLIRWVVVAALVSTVFLAPAPYAVASAGLLLFHLLDLVGSLGVRNRLVLSIATAVVLPMSADAAGAGILGSLAVLPVLAAIAAGLREMAAVEDIMPSETNLLSTPGRMSTPLLNALVAAGGAAALMGLVAGHWVLALSGGAVLVGAAGLVGWIIYRLRGPWAQADPAVVRAVVGRPVEIEVSLRFAVPVRGKVHLRSPHEWMRVGPPLLEPRDSRSAVRLLLRPPFAGPSRIVLEAEMVDPWGLTITPLQVPVADLHIIPRARYAAWLARRYLERTPPGAAAVATAHSGHGRLRGAEYFGSRPYEAGDSLRAIDWKRTLKLQQLVSKDFRAVSAQAAVIAVNLEAGDPDSADRLAHDLVMKSLTLAQEGVPQSIAAYTGECVVEVNPPLAPRDAVLAALRLTARIITVRRLRRTLEPPRLVGLRRARHALSDGLGGRLADVIALEIEVLAHEAARHPATAALQRVARYLRPPASLVTISVVDGGAAVPETTVERFAALGYRPINVP